MKTAKYIFTILAFFCVFIGVALCDNIEEAFDHNIPYIDHGTTGEYGYENLPCFPSEITGDERIPQGNTEEMARLNKRIDDLERRISDMEEAHSPIAEAEIERMLDEIKQRQWNTEVKK